MIILRQEAEGAKYKMICIFPLQNKSLTIPSSWPRAQNKSSKAVEQEDVRSVGIRATMLCKKLFFQDMFWDHYFKRYTGWDRWEWPHWQGLPGWCWFCTYPDRETKHQRNGLGEILSASRTRWERLMTAASDWCIQCKQWSRPRLKNYLLESLSSWSIILPRHNSLRLYFSHSDISEFLLNV